MGLADGAGKCELSVDGGLTDRAIPDTISKLRGKKANIWQWNNRGPHLAKTDTNTKERQSMKNNTGQSKGTISTTLVHAVVQLDPDLVCILHLVSNCMDIRKRLLSSCPYFLFHAIWSFFSSAAAGGGLWWSCKKRGAGEQTPNGWKTPYISIAHHTIRM